MDSTEHLPETARQLILRIGLSDALKVMETFGGDILFIPKYPDHKLVKRLVAIIPLKAVQSLSDLWGGDRIYIPKLDHLARQVRDEEIVFKHAKQSNHSIAKEYGISERHVRRIVGKFRAQEDSRHG